VSDRPRRSPDLDVTPAADGYLLRTRRSDAVTWLNRTGYLVLELCTGANSETQIAAALRDAFALPEPPLSAVRDTVSELVAAGVVDPGEGATVSPGLLQIAIWAPGAAVHPEVLAGVLALREDVDSARIPARLVVDLDRSMRAARSRAANRCLHDGDTTHVLFLDATPEALAALREASLPRLMASRHEVIGIPVASPRPDWDRALDASRSSPDVSAAQLEAFASGYDVSLVAGAEGDLDTGFVEARHCGSGALLVQRSALERLAGAGVANRHRGSIVQGAVTGPGGWGFFDPALSKDGIDIDEDLAFCERVRASGGRVMVDASGSFGTCLRILGRLQEQGR
jgi:hypothetical protein